MQFLKVLSDILVQATTRLTLFPVAFVHVLLKPTELGLSSFSARGGSDGG